MNNIEINIIVEGQTERKFVKEILAPYLASRGIFVFASLIGKPGQKGGDVRFVRAQKDISKFLKQRSDTFVSLFVDYYGLGTDWPGLNEIQNGSTPRIISDLINTKTKERVVELNRGIRAEERFIPFVAVHEFETLLFSDAELLASHLNVESVQIAEIIDEFSNIEAINNSYETAPSKRLEKLYDRFNKTTTGIAIAKDIGIERMREKSLLFDEWIKKLEKITRKG